MKLLQLLVLACMVGICGCVQVERSQVGYNELANSMVPGKQVTLVAKSGAATNIIFTSLQGDVINGTLLDNSDEHVSININDLTKIRVH